MQPRLDRTRPFVRRLSVRQFVLVFVERELLHLRGRVQCLYELLKFTALKCPAREEVNAHEWFNPALSLTQFIHARYGLLNDLECVSAVSNSELRLAVFQRREEQMQEKTAI
jgi:hypothetical protein